MKKALKIIIPILVILAIIIIICVVSVNKYFDTHTWSTVEISGVSDGETEDAYYEQRECLKDDQISVGTLTLVVTNIEHDGTLQFSVKYGELKDDEGNVIKTDELKLMEQKHYKSGNDSFSLRITSHGYE